ncbi:MAG: hypothetical protein ABSA68_09680 [Xanthobacteraceae bacterium]|jgi:hypothetical protein
MPFRTIAAGLIGAFALLGVLLFAGPAGAVQLITASEAALPAGQAKGHERGITPAPSVVIVSPSPAAGMMKSPVSLKIRYEGHGGAKIDVDSVLLTYVRSPEIDLTQRIKPFIAADGIDVQDADVPPGTHTIRVLVTDTEGRTNWADFTFTVGQ